MTFRNNFVHHNVGDGIWYDGDNTGALVEGNRVEDNGRIRHLLRGQQRRHHPEQHCPAERETPGWFSQHVQERRRFTTTRSNTISGGSPTSSTAARRLMGVI